VQGEEVCGWGGGGVGDPKTGQDKRMDNTTTKKKSFERTQSQREWKNETLQREDQPKLN